MREDGSWRKEDGGRRMSAKVLRWEGGRRDGKRRREREEREGG